MTSATASSQPRAQIGVTGLAVMGSNLARNLARHGHTVAVHNRSTAKIDALLTEHGDEGDFVRADSLEDLIGALEKPRRVLIMVKAGDPTDAVISDLAALMEPGDIIIDGGNALYTDTRRREAEMREKDLHFVGAGVSGGEEGALNGPSIMPGGSKEAYKALGPLLESIAAHVDGTPCCTHVGPDGAGHFVKMVHNGIEYGLMELLAETYGLMKNGLGMDNAAIGQVFAQWNEGRLQSFLVDITKDIFAFDAPGTDHLLLDDIKDEARAKGTGKWTSQVAMDLQAPIPTVDAAVSMRDLSKYKDLRVQLAQQYGPEAGHLAGDKEELLKQLEQALYFSMIISYAQGMHLLAKASEEFKYDLKLATIAKIWRGGCIIRSTFLNDIYNAFEHDNTLAHLLLDGNVNQLVQGSAGGARGIIAAAVLAGQALPAYAASLGYFDAFRTARLPSNLIQAQRDYFGAHTYELIGKEGVFHTQWTGLRAKPEAGPGTEANQTPTTPPVPGTRQSNEEPTNQHQ